MADRVRTFTYLKEDQTVKQYQVLTLKEVSKTPTTSIEGISLLDLTEEQKKELLEADKAYSEVLGKYMKHYRRFNIDRIKG